MLTKKVKKDLIESTVSKLNAKEKRTLHEMVCAIRTNAALDWVVPIRFWGDKEVDQYEGLLCEQIRDAEPKEMVIALLDKAFHIRLKLREEHGTYLYAVLTQRLLRAQRFCDNWSRKDKENLSATTDLVALVCATVAISEGSECRYVPRLFAPPEEQIELEYFMSQIVGTRDLDAWEKLA